MISMIKPFYCDLHETGVLKVSGPDAKKLLQGQLTINVETLSANGQLGAHCNPQGRVISLFHLFLWQNDYCLLMPKDVIAKAMQALKKYAVFYKVNLYDASDEFCIIGYRGNNLPPASALQLTYGKSAILLDHASQKASFLLKVKPELVALDTWKYATITDGIPTVYSVTSELFLPHEINLPELQAVNFDKGCYTGQEIIARMHYKGKLKTHLYRATTTSSLKPGWCLKPNGSIVEACQLDYNNHYALIITDETSAQNNQLQVEETQAFLTLI